MTLHKSVSVVAGFLLMLGVGWATVWAQGEQPKQGQAKPAVEDNAAVKNKRIVYPVRYGAAKDLAAVLKPLTDAIGQIQEDQQSKELLRSLIDDEMSSGKWLMEVHKMLSGASAA